MNKINTGFTILASSQTSLQLTEDFSSQIEWFPWWQISFDEQICIAGVSLEGFLEGADQPPLITILLSDDGENWLPVWTQPFHEIDFQKNISGVFKQTYSARHIRVRYDGYGSLSFRDINIKTLVCLGNENKVGELLFNYEKSALEAKVVISTLFNESEDYLRQYIDNFLAYSPDNVSLIINFPTDRLIPDYAKKISSRIHLFNGNIHREKWGHTLLLGHLEAFREAQIVFPNFNYFSTMASNGLMVRKMNIAAILEQLSLGCRVPVACERAYERDLDVDVLEPTFHGTWMWHHFRNTTGLGEFLSEKLEIEQVSATQIEGLFARREDWNQLHVRKDKIRELGSLLSFENFMAIEEILPTAIFDQFGTGQYTHICKVHWLGTRLVTISDLLEMVPNLPDHVCALKWFERSRTALPTLAVTTPWGRSLLELGQNQQYDIEQFQRVTFAKKLLSKACNEERFGALTNRWWANDEQGEVGFNWSIENLPCSRQIVPCEIPNCIPARIFPAYFFMEDTGLRVSISLTIRESSDGENILRMACTALTDKGVLVSGVRLQGYLYLSGLQGDTVFCLTLQDGKCSPADVLARIVFHNENDYEVDYPDRIEHFVRGEKRYFARTALGKDGQVWIGLPVYCNSTIEVGLSIGPNFCSHRILEI
ncbi:hypothetical protein [Oecophyllibacter saccharovorans]|uniref:Discoidin domain-containing protein n=1 Tax=Oecophyllibacter saccharovorans TaxID=2558360 RepID=A0A506USL4_9PROT|nr:hypothetical protein [Oecophyllibacter saccharovorans]TPW36083.1 hypothetical protein E3202_04085 [Oecophyllibacter saccharovorans]